MKRYISATIADISSAPLQTKIAIAKNPKTRPNVLEKLSADKDPIIRYVLSKNPNTPEGLITEEVEWARYHLYLDCYIQDDLQNISPAIEAGVRSIIDAHGFDCEKVYLDDYDYDDRNQVSVDAEFIGVIDPNYGDLHGYTYEILVDVEKFIENLGYDVYCSDYAWMKT